MPQRLEEVKNDAKTDLLDKLFQLPPREIVREAIVIFWYGLTGKHLPDMKAEKDKEESNSSDT